MAKSKSRFTAKVMVKIYYNRMDHWIEVDEAEVVTIQFRSMWARVVFKSPFDKSTKSTDLPILPEGKDEPQLGSGDYRRGYVSLNFRLDPDCYSTEHAKRILDQAGETWSEVLDESDSSCEGTVRVYDKRRRNRRK